MMTKITIQQSGAFVDNFSLEPTGDGPLAGLTFAVKDIIDVAGHRTGCGNPTWLAAHPPATVHAVCVEQLLASGGRLVGKTITDEFAFSLLGENHFYGTPLNPAASDRIPGGSSNGSVSAVACGLADFALGTDTGGSVRVPASNCGIWGLRPSHGFISVAGVMPFAPTFDTVGILARNVDILRKAAAVLLAGDPPTTASSSAASLAPKVHLVPEAFALADAEVRQALAAPIERLRHLLPGKVRETSLGELCADRQAADLSVWFDTYCVLQWSEIDSSLGAWIAEAKPELGPRTAASLKMVRSLDRTRIASAARFRERCYRQLEHALRGGDLLCIPTAPAVAPLKGAAGMDRLGDYYKRALSLTSLAGLGRLAQVSMPLASVSGVPIGLSLLAARGGDLQLLEVAELLAAA
jgi:amidase